MPEFFWVRGRGATVNKPRNFLTRGCDPHHVLWLGGAFIAELPPLQITQQHTDQNATPTTMKYDL